MATLTRRTLILAVAFVCTFGVASFASANIISELQQTTYTVTHSVKVGTMTRSYKVIGPVAALPDSAPIVVVLSGIAPAERRRRRVHQVAGRGGGPRPQAPGLRRPGIATAAASPTSWRAARPACSTGRRW